MEALVSNEQLNIVSEEDVFNAVMFWVQYDENNRTQHIAKVRSRELILVCCKVGCSCLVGVLLKIYEIASKDAKGVEKLTKCASRVKCLCLVTLPFAMSFSPWVQNSAVLSPAWQ